MSIRLLEIHPTIDKSNIKYISKLRPVNSACGDEENSSEAKQTNAVFLVTSLYIFSDITPFSYPNYNSLPLPLEQIASRYQVVCQ